MREQLELSNVTSRTSSMCVESTMVALLVTSYHAWLSEIRRRKYARRGLVLDAGTSIAPAVAVIGRNLLAFSFFEITPPRNRPKLSPVSGSQ